MTSRNIFVGVLGIAAMSIMLIVGIVEFRQQRTRELGACPEGTVPTHHPGECRELLPIETDTTFPWDKQQAEAKEFFRRFQKSVTADERHEVASMMMYPLRVLFYTDPKPADYRFLNSPTELLDVYDDVFHISVKDYIARYDADEVWGNDYFLQTGIGQIGIYCTTLGECPTCSFEFKVKIVRSNSIYRDTVEDAFGNPLKLKDKP
ncbi:MAG: hypothetical protein AB7Q37_06850 [Pyrinomonadaceae bacterium]